MPHAVLVVRTITCVCLQECDEGYDCLSETHVSEHWSQWPTSYSSGGHGGRSGVCSWYLMPHLHHSTALSQSVGQRESVRRGGLAGHQWESKLKRVGELRRE